MKTVFSFLLIFAFCSSASNAQKSAPNLPLRIQNNLGSNGWSADGRLFVTYTRRTEKTRLWDLKDESVVWENSLSSTRGRMLNSESFIWSNSQRYLLVKDERGMLFLLDPLTGKVRWEKNVLKKPEIIRFSPDETQIIVVYSDKTAKTEVELLDVENGSRKSLFNTDAKFFDTFAFSGDGKILKFGNFEGKADLVSAEDGKLLKSLSLRPCGTLQNTFSNKTTFSPKLNYLVARCRDKTVITDSATGKVVSILTMKDDFDNTIGFSGDEKVLVLSDLAGYKIFNFKDHSVRDISDFRLWFSVDLNYDGSLLINNSDYRHRGYEIADVKTGKVIKTFENHPGEILSLAFSRDGQLFASGSQDRIVRVWDAKTHNILHSLSGHSDEVQSVEFTDNDNELISKSEMETIVWNARTGAKIRETKESNRFDQNRDLALSPSGKFALVEEYEKPFRLVDVKTKKTLKEFAYVDQLDNLVFTPDEKHFLAKPWWSGWQLWSVESGKPIREFDIGYSYYNHVAFQPNGKVFITGGSDQNIIMFDLETGEKIWSLFPLDVEEFDQQKAGELQRVTYLQQQKEYAARADIDNQERAKKITAAFSHYGSAESFWDQKIAESGIRNKSKLTLPRDKASVAWFTLTNNSDLAVSIDTNSMIFNPKCNGLCDGAEISSRYVMESKNGDLRVNGYDMYSKTILPPKTTVYFSVDLNHFAASNAIYLEFTFQKDNPADEKSNDYGNQQKLYLNESDLPVRQ